MKKVLSVIFLICMTAGLVSQLVFADTVSPSTEEKSKNDLFIVNASESYAGSEGENGTTVVTKNVSVDGIIALEIVNNHIIPALDIVGKGFEEKTVYLLLIGEVIVILWRKNVNFL